jgi:hypothetical protein
LTLPDGTERSGQVLEARGECNIQWVNWVYADEVRIGDRAVVQVKLLELLGEAETDCD